MRPGTAGNMAGYTPPPARPCDCGRGSIEFLDVNGAVVLRFIRLRDGYYGGSVSDACWELYPGPHCWLGVGSLLDLVAKLADHEPPRGLGWAYEVTGGTRGGYERLSLTRHMDAKRLATALGCTEQEVRERFGVVVKVA